MRFRPANIRLINRRSNLPRLLLALSSGKSKSNDNDKNNPIDSAGLTGSLHISPYHSPRGPIAAFSSVSVYDLAISRQSRIPTGCYGVFGYLSRFEPAT